LVTGVVGKEHGARVLSTCGEHVHAPTALRKSERARIDHSVRPEVTQSLK
jgi:hypothetical protein